MNLHDLRETQANFTKRIDDVLEERKHLYKLRTAFANQFSAKALSNQKVEDYVTYTKDTVEFLNPVTGVSKLSNEIQAAKNDTIKFSVRLERIAHFIASPNAISLKDLTLADGTTLDSNITI